MSAHRRETARHLINTCCNLCSDLFSALQAELEEEERRQEQTQRWEMIRKMNEAKTAQPQGAAAVQKPGGEGQGLVTGGVSRQGIAGQEPETAPALESA